jgi:hypothetical protein
MKTTINDIINALHLAKNDKKLVKRLEESFDMNGCCIASTIIFDIMNQYRAGRLKGQSVTVFHDMLMDVEMVDVAKTAVIENAGWIANEYLYGIVNIEKAVTGSIEDALKEQEGYQL